MPRQNWLTFQRNHKDALAAMDFFAVPTARFQLLSVGFVFDHDRRLLIHSNVTTGPTARWVIQRTPQPGPGVHRARRGSPSLACAP